MNAQFIKPQTKPDNPNFSSGPCAKRPGWSIKALENALTGRSHRAGPCKEKLLEVIDLHRDILRIPSDYKIGIVPASDTGAVEMAMWSMLGARGLDIIAFESFSTDWLKDVSDHLKLENVRYHTADYGKIPDLSEVSPENDCVFVWNGTTSGVRVPDGDWISSARKGITICDATSAVFAYDMPWEKLDVTTWSWQKVLGGEAAHGMIVLSPRAVERLESFKPDRPLPKIFRMTKGGKLNEGIFKGETINTPSMVAVEDCLDALKWIKEIGGLDETIARCRANLAAIEDWVETSEWAGFLCEDMANRSCTSICLILKESWFTNSDNKSQAGIIKQMCVMLENGGVAYDIKSYKSAPNGLRIWGGATIEYENIQRLLPWLDYAYQSVKAEHAEKSAAA